MCLCAFPLRWQASQAHLLMSLKNLNGQVVRLRHVIQLISKPLPTNTAPSAHVAFTWFNWDGMAAYIDIYITYHRTGWCYGSILWAFCLKPIITRNKLNIVPGGIIAAAATDWRICCSNSVSETNNKQNKYYIITLILGYNHIFIVMFILLTYCIINKSRF